MVVCVCECELPRVFGFLVHSSFRVLHSLKKKLYIDFKFNNKTGRHDSSNQR